MKTIPEIKEDYRQKLLTIGNTMDGFQKMQVALNLKMSLRTVERYTSGKEELVSDVEKAETIYNECKKVMQTPQTTKA